MKTKYRWLVSWSGDDGRLHAWRIPRTGLPKDWTLVRVRVITSRP